MAGEIFFLSQWGVSIGTESVEAGGSARHTPAHRTGPPQAKDYPAPNGNDSQVGEKFCSDLRKKHALQQVLYIRNYTFIHPFSHLLSTY